MAKVSKMAAHYRRGRPGRNCRVCAHMHRDGTCAKVQGIVKPEMTSDFFKAK